MKKEIYTQSINRELNAIGDSRTVKVKPSENRYVWLVIGIITLVTIGLSLSGLVSNHLGY